MEGQQIAEFFGRDQFAKENGMKVVEVRPGYGRAEMTVDPHHLNAVASSRAALCSPWPTWRSPPL